MTRRRATGGPRCADRWRRGARALVAAGLGVTLCSGAGAQPAASGLPDLPLPDLVATLTPPGLRAPRPAGPLLPVPPVSAPQSLAGEPPTPRFTTVLAKPHPPMGRLETSGCAPTATPPGVALADCGINRLFRGDVGGGRQALTESLALDPLGVRAPAAQLWLAEVALQDGRDDEAERRYRAALGRGLRGEAGSHAALGAGWAALRRGAPDDARRWLAEVSASGPSDALRRLARFLDGVAQLLGGQPAEALVALEAIASTDTPGSLAAELLFWRGIALTRLGRWEAALEELDRFVAMARADHPLRAAAFVQAGWVALEQGLPEEAERRFLLAEAEPAFELRGAVRLGRVRASLGIGDAARAVELARQATGEPLADAGARAWLLLAADTAARSGLTGHAEAAYRQFLGLSQDPALGDYATYRLGEVLEAAGRTAEAADLYRWLRDQGREEPIAQRATYRLGLLALQAGDWAEALHEGEGLLRAGTLPELRAGALLLTAAGAALTGDPRRAAGLYRAALGDGGAAPWMPAARVAFGWVALEAGDPMTALAEWGSASASADLEMATLALLATAEVRLRDGREAEALPALRQLLARPLDRDAAEAVRLNLAVLAIRAARYDEAVAVLEPLRNEAGRALPATLYHALGVAHYQRGQYALADQEFQRAAGLAPGEHAVWLGTGLTALAQDRVGEAEATLAQARIGAPPEIEALVAYGLVVAAARRGDDEAFRQRAVSFVERHRGNPAAGAVLGGLVAVTIARQNLDEADGWVQRLLRDQPRSPHADEALLRLARAAQGPRPELARRAFRDLIARQPGPLLRTEAWLGLAEAASAVGDDWHVERALTGFLADAPPGDPRLPAAYGLLVRALGAQGHRSRALHAAEGFLARARPGADVAAIQFLRGELLLQDGRWDAARTAFETASADGEPAVAAAAHVRLGEGLRARGEPEAAIAAYLSAVYLYPETPEAVQGLRGAAEVCLARQMRREAGILLRKLLVAPGADAGTARWAREILGTLGPSGAVVPPR